jgi:hypothetical protein
MLEKHMGQKLVSKQDTFLIYLLDLVQLRDTHRPEVVEK